MELTLSSLGAAMIHFYDLAKQQNSPDISSTATYLAIAFFLLLWVLCTHQDWELRPRNKMGQYFWLGGVSNFVGVMLFATFIVLVKGI